jgi:hypothetical protein
VASGRLVVVGVVRGAIVRVWLPDFVPSATAVPVTVTVRLTLRVFGAV